MRKALTWLFLGMLLPVMTFGFSINGKVKLVQEQLTESEKLAIIDLPGKMESYFQSALYSNLDIDIDYRLELNLKPKSSANAFSAMMQLFDNKHKIQYLDKKVNIYYDPYEILMFNEYQFHRLTSTFDFYFYMMIGEIADNMRSLGGDPYFQKAKKIADDAMMQSDYYGWDRRQDKIESMLRSELFPFRKAKFAINSGFLAAREQDMEICRKNMLAGLKMINESVEEIDGEAKEITSYLNRVYLDIADIFKEEEESEVINLLMKVDTVHTEYYNNL